MLPLRSLLGTLAARKKRVVKSMQSCIFGDGLSADFLAFNGVFEADLKFLILEEFYSIESYSIQWGNSFQEEASRFTLSLFLVFVEFQCVEGGYNRLHSFDFVSAC